MKNQNNLTHDELISQLDYNPLTGIFKWKIAKGNSIKGSIAGHKRKDGYIHIGINKISYYAHVLAWFHYYGYMPEKQIDHRNQIKHNNWILNLREASSQCQARNQKDRINNTSSVKGVYQNQINNNWKSSIGINGKDIYLGSYKNFDNAVCARLAGEQCVNWAGCDSKSPAFKYVRKNIQGYQ